MLRHGNIVWSCRIVAWRTSVCFSNLLNETINVVPDDETWRHISSFENLGHIKYHICALISVLKNIVKYFYKRIVEGNYNVDQYCNSLLWPSNFCGRCAKPEVVAWRCPV